MTNTRFQVLDDEDMVSITHDAHLLCKLKNFQAQELYEASRSTLQLTDKNQANYHWFDEGIASYLLPASRSNAGWIEGTIKLCLAFQPNDWQGAGDNSSVYIPNNEDVLEIVDTTARLLNRQNVLMNQLTSHIRQHFGITDPAQSRYYWLDRGIECKVLKVSGERSGWQVGLIRWQFEFTPVTKPTIEEIETIQQSGLDSLRQLAMN